MKITTLLENSSALPELKPKHGISLFIEKGDTRILFDVGPDDTFIRNAEKLGVDLSTVDYLILSHGHFDHGGGLKSFLQINQKANVFLKLSATGNFYAKLFWIFKLNIGLKLKGLDMNRFEFLSENRQLENGINIMTSFSKNGYIPAGNQSLFTKDENGKLYPDPFDHELALLLRNENHNVLFTGCSHSGLGNMIGSVLDQAKLDSIDTVIGGFHLYNPVKKSTESTGSMDKLIDEISIIKDAVFYTGHCTGEEAFGYLKSKLGERIQPFNTGTIINL